MTAPETSLLFVYNADSGLFNTMADIGHKIFSPASYSCDLCMLTHGYLTEKKAWRDFVERLGIECQFLHRDQFHQRYPEDTSELPAIFLLSGESIQPCATARQLRDCKNLEQLQQLILDSCLSNNDTPRTVP